MPHSFAELLVLKPKTLFEAVALLADANEPVHIMAGGTGLLERAKTGRCWDGVILNINDIKHLDDVACRDTELAIGALCNVHELAHSPVIRAVAPQLSMAAAEFAPRPDSRLATLGGRIMSALTFDPTLSALVALGARVVLASDEGERRAPIYAFFAGANHTVARTSEILVKVIIPRTKLPTCDYYGRMVLDDGDLALAGRLQCQALRGDTRPISADQIRLGLTGLGATVMRLFETEKFLCRCGLNTETAEKALPVMIAEAGFETKTGAQGGALALAAEQMLSEFLVMAMAQEGPGAN